MIILNGTCLNFTDHIVDETGRTITLTPRKDYHEHSLIEFCTMGKGVFSIIFSGSNIKYNVSTINNCADRFIFMIESIGTLDEPNTSRTIKTPYVKRLETRNAELLEAVKKAHEILLHEMDNGRTPSMLKGVGLGYFEDVICGID